MRTQRTFRVAGDGAFETSRRGLDVLEAPVLNKGSAFTLEERTQLGLHGLLPTAVTTIDLQAERSYAQYGHQRDDLAKHLFLDSLHDRNEVLYYRVLSEHLAEMLPIVYTPTVGAAIERYSKEFQRPRGVYLCVDDEDGIDVAFDNFGAEADDIDLIVATDAEQILGIGDWGVGGIAISVGKLAVYTAAAGINPNRVIPVMLDVGTDRQELLEYPAYMGARHSRVSGDDYDKFIDRFVRSATSRFPNALIHWEDFGASNARRMLQRYRERICTFNDDMQGTGAVVLGGVIAAVRAAGTPFSEQRVVISRSRDRRSGYRRLHLQRDGARRYCQATRQGAGSGAWAAMVSSLRAWRRGCAISSVRTPGLRRRCAPGSPKPGRSVCSRWYGLCTPRYCIGCAAQPSSFTEEVVADGRQRGSADHLRLVEPDIPFGGGTVGSDRLERGPRSGRNRQPVPSRPARRLDLHDRPGEQRPGLPRSWAWNHRIQSTGGQRPYAARCGGHGCRVR